MIRNRRKQLFLLILLLAALAGCGGSQKTLNPVPENPFEQARVGTDSTLEIMTWNLEHFAKAGTKTADHVVDVISGLAVDVVAMQEITSESYFQKVVDQLEGWDGYRADSAGADLDLAFIYRTGDLLDVTAIYEIMVDESRAFPRRPLVLEGTLDGQSYVVINNHFKCCGDGAIDEDDDWDEENRRRTASLLLQQYVADHYAGRRVIIVGDFNDEITDVPEDNVFQNFIADPGNWKFTDMAIARDQDTLWSYPSWPSQIDHVLINGNTFPGFAAEEATIQVMPLQTYLAGGWNVYDAEISDHLPVVLRLMP